MASVIAMPDGRTILVGAVIGDQQVLVSRRLDRMETSRIRGSEGADRAFTSPDGRWVAFAARGKLMKLPRIARVPGFDALQQDRRVGELIQPMGLPTNASTPR